MPIQWQTITVPLGIGSDEKTHSFVVQPKNLLVCKDGKFAKSGSV